MLIYYVMHWRNNYTDVMRWVRWFALLFAAGSTHSLAVHIFNTGNIYYFAIYTLIETYILIQLYHVINHHKHQLPILIGVWAITSIYMLYCIIISPDQYPINARCLQAAVISMLYVTALIGWFNRSFNLYQLLIILPIAAYYLTTAVMAFGFHAPALTKFIYILFDTLNITISIMLISILKTYLNNHGRNHHHTA